MSALAQRKQILPVVEVDHDENARRLGVSPACQGHFVMINTGKRFPDGRAASYGGGRRTHLPYALNNDLETRGMFLAPCPLDS